MGPLAFLCCISFNADSSLDYGSKKNLSIELDIRLGKMKKENIEFNFKSVTIENIKSFIVI